MCIHKVQAEQELAMKRNIEEVAQGVGESVKRPSAATKSGGQMAITGIMSASSSSILSSAIASYILTEGLHFGTVNSSYLKRTIEAAKHAPAGIGTAHLQ